MFPKDKKRQFLLGMQSAIPVVIAYLPMGIAYAITARSAGLYILETIMMSVCVFTGAGQMLAAQMLVENADLIVIVIATFVINLRYIIMSTCVVNGLKGSPLYLKMMATFGVTDEAFAIFTTRREDHRSMTYWMGLMLTTYASWISGAVIGAFTSNILPDILRDSFGIAMYAMFIAIVVPGLKGNRPLVWVVCITAVLSTLFSLFLDSAWSVVCATIIGAGIGVYIMPDEGNDTNDANDNINVDAKTDEFDDTVTDENAPFSEKGGQK